MLEIICGLGAKTLHSKIFTEYAEFAYLLLGSFIVIIGLSTIVYKKKKLEKVCSWLNKGNIRNAGILGLLVGFTPCFFLLGMLNYITLISQTVLDAVIFSLAFGLGTIFSPLIILIMLSSKLANILSSNEKLKLAIRITSGMILLFLGGKTILQNFLR